MKKAVLAFSMTAYWMTLPISCCSSL